MSIILLLDILGTISFSISGMLTALKKRLDLFGVFIIAFVTALGGGTLRDLLLDAPIGWMFDVTYVYVIIAAAIVALIFRKKLGYVRKSLFLFDTIGIALYTVVGVQKGLDAQLPAIICIALGTMSASFGGVIRDILCNEIPIIFRKEIYATACILGAGVYLLLLKTDLSVDLVMVFSGLVVIVVRVLAVRFKLSLPSLYPKEENN